MDVSVQRELTNRAIKNETLSISLLQEQVVDAVNHAKFQNTMQSIPELPRLEPAARFVPSVSEPVPPSSPFCCNLFFCCPKSLALTIIIIITPILLKLKMKTTMIITTAAKNNSSNIKCDKMEKSVSIDPALIGNRSIEEKRCDDDQSYVPLSLDASEDDSHADAAAEVLAAETREYFNTKNNNLQNKTDVTSYDETQADNQAAPPVTISQQPQIKHVRAGTGNNNNNNNNPNIAGNHDCIENGNVRESHIQQPMEMGNELTPANSRQFVRQLRLPLQWNQNHDLMAECDMIPQLPEPTGNWCVDEANFTRVFARLQESMDTLPVLQGFIEKHKRGLELSKIYLSSKIYDTYGWVAEPLKYYFYFKIQINNNNNNNKITMTQQTHTTNNTNTQRTTHRRRRRTILRRRRTIKSIWLGLEITWNAWIYFLLFFCLGFCFKNETKDESWELVILLGIIFFSFLFLVFI